MSFLPLAKPMISNKEVEEVVKVLRSGWLTTGSNVLDFEKSVCNYVNCKHAIGLTSCTGGLHIALAALGIGPGDEVIVPTYTFVASGHVVAWLGAKPVLVDVDISTFNIDPNKIEEAITKNTKAIMPVHFGGHPCEMDKILKIAKKHKLFVVEDAAHAIGSRYKGRMIGSFGDVAVFSFYATKTITTAEGGMIVTNNAALGDKMRKLSYFGVDKDAFGRYSNRGKWYYEVVDLGFKYNMDNIQGAIGNEQMKRIEKFINRKREVVALYNKLLKNIKGIILPSELNYARSSVHLYPLLVTGISRDLFINKLKDSGIGASVHFIPLHLHPYYQNVYRYKRGDFPIAEYIFDHEVSLPLWPGMSNKDVKYIVSVIKKIMKPKIMLIAEASRKKGFGDVVSLMNISNGLKDDFDFVFLINNNKEAIKFVRGRGYSCVVLPNNVDTIDFIEDISDEMGIKHCFVQKIPNDPDYIKELSKFMKVMMIDFFGNIPVYSDILLCWDVDAQKLMYNFVNKDACKMLGVKYVPIDKSILRYKNNGANSKIKNILVTFGGSDPYNMTQAVRKIISKYSEFSWTVVVGPGYNKRFVGAKNIKIIKSPKDIYGLISKSDLVICGGGLTMFEVRAIGVPCFCMSAVPWEVNRLEKLVNINKPFVVDGKGVDRIASCIRKRWLS